jgi:hypothetical protein
MREYHRTHSWSGASDGFRIQHSFDHMGPNSLSWWDDVEFVRNGRRIIVSWQHPRAAYAQAVSELASALAGQAPPRERLKFRSTRNYCLVGKSGRRKKLASYTPLPPSEEQLQYDARLRNIENRLTSEGIDLDIAPSWSWWRLPWAMNVKLISPAEVRCRNDQISVAGMARRLIERQTTIHSEFPAFSYGRSDWIKDQLLLSAAGH